MRRLLYILLPLLALSSCTLTEYHDNYYPYSNKTHYAYEVYESTLNEVKMPIAALDLALRANQWKEATSQEDRDSIEDKYFRNFKLRIEGDTIRIFTVYYYDSYTIYDDEIKIITDNTKIDEVGSVWELILGGSVMNIERTADSQLKLTNKNEKFNGLKFEFNVIDKESSTVAGEREFVISGECETIVYECSAPIKVMCNIANELVFGRFYASGGPLYSSVDMPSSGAVVINEMENEREKYDIEVTISSRTEVSYRGYTDIYDFNYYN